MPLDRADDAGERVWEFCAGRCQAGRLAARPRRTYNDKAAKSPLKLPLVYRFHLLLYIRGIPNAIWGKPLPSVCCFLLILREWRSIFVLKIGR